MAVQQEEPVDAPSNGTNGRVTYRDVTDMMSRMERELRDGQSRMEGKMDAFIVSHALTHVQEQERIAKTNQESAVWMERGRQALQEHDGLHKEVNELREWRAEVRGMTALVKFALGTSVVGAIVSMITLLTMLSQIMPK